ncbi:alpha/beta hydrolase fold domain-containing protein [Actinomadura sp. WAC 06369]|uniref:alpha/beta hydrolase fold domain-containing protein n=1 Tax=Actinomadura sp. WAC 06369 TaxID=2203193 RepID=UPI001F4219C5|nr:alpha/beta hydrolase fold domain-containing protein [Actinomadura sp. WAC 06369]
MAGDRLINGRAADGRAAHDGVPDDGVLDDGALDDGALGDGVPDDGVPDDGGAGAPRIEEGPAGPVLRPPGRADKTVLYLRGDRPHPAASASALEPYGRLALRANAAVVLPRHRAEFPAALDDVHRAYERARESGPVMLAGDRLGGGLAAALLVRLRDTGAAQPACAVLVSALLDLTLEAPSLLLNAAADPTFDLDALRERVARHAGDTPRTDPLLSPLHANLHGFPPLRLLTAGTDPLLDDSLSFAARAARSGVTVDLRVLQDAADLRTAFVPAVADFMDVWSPRTDPADRSEGARERGWPTRNRAS